MKTWDDVRRRIDNYRTFKANWDSYEAAEPTCAQIDRAIEATHAFEQNGFPVPHAAALSSGGDVGFEWDSNGYTVIADTDGGFAAYYVNPIRLNIEQSRQLKAFLEEGNA